MAQQARIGIRVGDEGGTDVRRVRTTGPLADLHETIMGTASWMVATAAPVEEFEGYGKFSKEAEDNRKGGS